MIRPFKKYFAWITVLSVLLASLPVRADEDPLADIKAYRADIKAKFPGHIKTGLDTLIHSYFAWRLTDFNETYASLQQASIDIASNQRKIEDLWIKSLNTPQSTPADSVIFKDFEARSLELFRTIRLAQYQEQNAEILLASLKSYREAWQVRCEDKTLHYAYEALDPWSHFNIDEVNFDPRSPEFAISFGVSSDTGLNNYGFESSVSVGNSGMIVTGASLIGMEVGQLLSTGSFLTASGAGAVASSAALWAAAGAGVAATLVIAIIAESDRASTVQEHWNIVKEIYDFQMGVINDASARAKETVKKSCEKMLNDQISDPSVTAGLDNKIALAQIQLQTAQEMRQGFLAQFTQLVQDYDSFTQRLYNQVYPALQANLLTQLRDASGVLLDREKEAQEFIKEKSAPLLVQIENAELKPLERIESQNKFFDQLIEGSSRYSPQSELIVDSTLLPTASGPFVSTWNTWLNLLNSRAAWKGENLK